MSVCVCILSTNHDCKYEFSVALAAFVAPYRQFVAAQRCQHPSRIHDAFRTSMATAIANESDG